MQVTSTVDHKRCGIVVRLERKKLALSLRHVASKVGISVSYLSALELGNRRWSRALFERVCDVLEASVSDD